MNTPFPISCAGCGKEIKDDNEPMLIIGKDPKEFCGDCMKWSSKISKFGKMWKVEPVISGVI